MTPKNTAFQVSLFPGEYNKKKPIYMLERIITRPEDYERPRIFSNKLSMYEKLSKEALIYRVLRSAGAAYPRRPVLNYRNWYRIIDEVIKNPEKEVFIDLWPKHDMSSTADVKNYRLSYHQWEK